MTTVKALGMTAEDSMICKAFFMFMFTPLVVLVLAGAGLAIAA
ncbi:MAG: hypothetical protein WBO34_13265 [Gammaproteobacteria bacterium]